MAPLVATVKDLRLVEEALPVLNELLSGEELQPAEIARLYGIAEDELGELQKLAQKYKFLITVRSRHASSIEWIKKFGALLKPETIKIKTVSDLDVRMGYSENTIGSLVFKKPEPLIRWEADGHPGAFEETVHEFLLEKGFTPETAEWKAAAKRVAERTDEWLKYEQEYKSWSKRGWVDVSLNYDGNAIDDSIRRQVTNPGGEIKNVNSKVFGFRLRQVGDEQYVVEMLNGKLGRFVPVTGDIDPIAFTHLDGSPLTMAEHASLLDDMANNPLLRTQHGESATFKKGGVDFVLGQFKPGEPGLQIAPGFLAPRAVHLDPTRSRWVSPLDYNLHWKGGFTYAGKYVRGPTAAPPEPSFLGYETAKPVPAQPGAPRAVPVAGPVGTANIGRCRMTYSNAPEAIPAFIGADGTIVLATADGGTSTSTLAETCFSEGPIVELAVTPQTTLDKAIPDGDPQEVAVAEDGSMATVDAVAGFVRGQRVVIGAGTEHAEVRTIVGFGSLILDRALTQAHSAGEVVVALPGIPLQVTVTRGSVTQPPRGPRPWRFGGHVARVDGQALTCSEEAQLVIGTLTVNLRRTDSTDPELCVYESRMRGEPPVAFELESSTGQWTAHGSALPTTTDLSRPVTVSLSIGQSRGSATIRFEHRGAVWQLTQPRSAPAKLALLLAPFAAVIRRRRSERSP
jgi:hypothetical protein